MDQTVWNTINGRIFQTSDDTGQIISRLSYHADFLLILLSPFYFLWSHPKMLLLAQTLTLGFGSVFVYLISQNILKNKNLALLFGFLFLMNPALQFTNLYDFHAVALATTTLLASFYFLIKKRYLPMVIFLILSGIAKEEIWVITSFFGIALLFQKIKQIKLLGLGIAFISLIIFGCLMLYAIPQNLGKQHFAISYFSDFGNSPIEIIKGAISSPQKIFLTIFEKDQLNYLKQIFLPLGFLSIFSPLYLIFAIPDLLINLLSNNSQLHQIYYQYSAAITPFIFISSIFSVKKILKTFPKISKLYIIVYLLIFTLFSAYFYGPMPVAKNPNLDMFKRPQKNQQIIEKFLSKIPEKYTVAATNNLGSHLSQREIIYTIPYGIDKADMVLFLRERSELINNLKSNKNYSEVLRIDDFIVFKKNNLL